MNGSCHKTLSLSELQGRGDLVWKQNINPQAAQILIWAGPYRESGYGQWRVEAQAPTFYPYTFWLPDKAPLSGHLINWGPVWPIQSKDFLNQACLSHCGFSTSHSLTLPRASLLSSQTWILPSNFATAATSSTFFIFISLKLDLVLVQEAVSKHRQSLRDLSIHQKGMLCPLDNRDF